MDKREIENLVKLTAIEVADTTICKFKPNFEHIADKAAEKAMNKAKEEWQKDIELHTAQCSAKKYKGVKSLIHAGIGGGIVAVINWVVRKL
jgi:hypothetical protein